MDLGSSSATMELVVHLPSAESVTLRLPNSYTVDRVKSEIFKTAETLDVSQKFDYYLCHDGVHPLFPASSGGGGGGRGEDPLPSLNKA